MSQGMKIFLIADIVAMVVMIVVLALWEWAENNPGIVRNLREFSRDLTDPKKFKDFLLELKDVFYPN